MWIIQLISYDFALVFAWLSEFWRRLLQYCFWEFFLLLPISNIVVVRIRDHIWLSNHLRNLGFFRFAGDFPCLERNDFLITTTWFVFRFWRFCWCSRCWLVIFHLAKLTVRVRLPRNETCMLLLLRGNHSLKLRWSYHRHQLSLHCWSIRNWWWLCGLLFIIIWRFRWFPAGLEIVLWSDLRLTFNSLFDLRFPLYKIYDFLILLFGWFTAARHLMV